MPCSVELVWGGREGSERPSRKHSGADSTGPGIDEMLRVHDGGATVQIVMNMRVRKQRERTDRNCECGVRDKIQFETDETSPERIRRQRKCVLTLDNFDAFLSGVRGCEELSLNPRESKVVWAWRGANPSPKISHHLR